MKLWPGPSAPRGAGGLRNPEHDPNRALRQRWCVSQASLACAWPKSGCIMIRANEAVMSGAQNAAGQRSEDRCRRTDIEIPAIITLSYPSSDLRRLSSNQGLPHLFSGAIMKVKVT